MGSDTDLASLLEIIRCPRSGQRLSRATGETLAKVNAAWLGGELKLDATVPQFERDTAFDAVLTTEDENGGYAVQNGIPILLPDHWFAVPGERAGY